MSSPKKPTLTIRVGELTVRANKLEKQLRQHADAIEKLKNDFAEAIDILKGITATEIGMIEMIHKLKENTSSTVQDSHSVQDSRKEAEALIEEDDKESMEELLKKAKSILSDLTLDLMNMRKKLPPQPPTI